MLPWLIEKNPSVDRSAKKLVALGTAAHPSVNPDGVMAEVNRPVGVGGIVNIDGTLERADCPAAFNALSLTA